jgi:hypothetical protein
VEIGQIAIVSLVVPALLVMDRLLANGRGVETLATRPAPAVYPISVVNIGLAATGSLLEPCSQPEPVRDQCLNDIKAEISQGIFIPDTAQEKPMEGDIIAAGPGARGEDGKVRPLDLKSRPFAEQHAVAAPDSIPRSAVIPKI